MSRRPPVKPFKIDKLSVPCTGVFVNPDGAEQTAGEIGSPQGIEEEFCRPAADVCRFPWESKGRVMAK